MDDLHGPRGAGNSSGEGPAPDEQLAAAVDEAMGTVPRAFLAEGEQPGPSCAKDRKVHMLRPIDPECSRDIALAFEGDWQWHEGAHVQDMIEDGFWEGWAPASVNGVLLYPRVTGLEWPRSWILAPWFGIFRAHGDEAGCTSVTAPVVSSAWAEELDWDHPLTVSGAEFLEWGLDAFFPDEQSG